MSYNRITKMKSTPENTKIVYNENGFALMSKELVDMLLQDHNCLWELENKIENGTLVELGYHIRKSYRNHDDQRYKIILIDEVEIDKIGYDGLTKAEAEAKLKVVRNDF
jgi:hypothetical protein